MSADVIDLVPIILRSLWSRPRPEPEEPEEEAPVYIVNPLGDTAPGRFWDMATELTPRGIPHDHPDFEALFSRLWSPETQAQSEADWAHHIWIDWVGRARKAAYVRRRIGGMSAANDSLTRRRAKRGAS